MILYLRVPKQSDLRVSLLLLLNNKIKRIGIMQVPIEQDRMHYIELSDIQRFR